ncbi:MAG: hypothetical protein Kow00109_19710 [Acidobacteriota bacterium]
MIRFLKVTTRILPLVLVACANHPDVAETNFATRWLALHLQAEVQLIDQEFPVGVLNELAISEESSLLLADPQLGVVRVFSATGEKIGYLQASESWEPLVVRTEPETASIYVCERGSRLWKFDGGVSRPARLLGRFEKMLDFHLHPSGLIIAMSCFDDGMEIRTYRDGELVASFLPSDERNVRLGKRTFATVTVDPAGVIYALQAYQPVVRKFNYKGEEVGAWEIRRNEYFRDFPDDAQNPFEVSRDWDFLERWRRSFTSFRRIYWVPPNLVCVFQMNDPPERPNVLDVYTTEGEYVGSAATNEYLVGARGRRLYFTDFHVFPYGDCVVKIYELPEEVPVPPATRGESETKRKEKS